MRSLFEISGTFLVAGAVLWFFFPAGALIILGTGAAVSLLAFMWAGIRFALAPRIAAILADGRADA